MEIITKALYWISTGLLVPVIIFLLYFFIKSLLMIGGFYGFYINRMKTNKKIEETTEQLNETNALDLLKDIKEKNKSELTTFIDKIIQYSHSKIHCEKILADYEIYADRDLGKSKTLTKIGPMLGLMGTLIPMGPALVGLATGDIASMAENMQIAFATTVVGILIGAIGFITLQIKQRWYTSDLNTLEFIVNLIQNGVVKHKECNCNTKNKKQVVLSN